MPRRLLVRFQPESFEVNAMSNITKLDVMTENILSGSDPRQAAVDAGYSDPSNALTRYRGNDAIHARNREIFEQLNLEPSTSYKLLIDVMTKATKTRKESKTIETQVVDDNGRLRIVEKVVSHYVEVPDYQARMAAAARYDFLVGNNPSNRVDVKVEGNVGGNVTMIFNQLVASMEGMTEQEKIAAHNEVKRQLTGKGK